MISRQFTSPTAGAGSRADCTAVPPAAGLAALWASGRPFFARSISNGLGPVRAGRGGVCGAGGEGGPETGRVRSGGGAIAAVILAGIAAIAIVGAVVSSDDNDEPASA